MTKKYMVLSSDGFTEDSDMIPRDNLQLLCWVKGNNIDEAFKNYTKVKKILW